MRGAYRGLPPARSVEQAIVVAQLMIARDLELRARRIAERVKADTVQAGVERLPPFGWD